MYDLYFDTNTKELWVQEDAQAQANAWGIEYMETSAKTNFHCKEAFEKLAQTIVKSKILNSRGSTCPCNII